MEFYDMRLSNGSGNFNLLRKCEDVLLGSFRAAVLTGYKYLV